MNDSRIIHTALSGTRHPHKQGAPHQTALLAKFPQLKACQTAECGWTREETTWRLICSAEMSRCRFRWSQLDERLPDLPHRAVRSVAVGSLCEIPRQQLAVSCYKNEPSSVPQLCLYQVNQHLLLFCLLCRNVKKQCSLPISETEIVCGHRGTE